MDKFFISEDGIYENTPQIGEGCCKLVMSKEVFIEAFNKWVTPFNGKDIIDACKFYYSQGLKHGKHEVDNE